MSRPGSQFLVINPKDHDVNLKKGDPETIDVHALLDHKINHIITNRKNDNTKNEPYKETNLSKLRNVNEITNYEDTFERMCRVCAEEQVAGISLCSEFVEDTILRDKISRYLHFQVSLDDPLPKIICMKCCAKLESFSIFVKNAQNTQEVLRTRLDIMKNKYSSYDNIMMNSKLNHEKINESIDKKGLIEKKLFDQLDDDVTIRLIKQVENDSSKPEIDDFFSQKVVIEKGPIKLDNNKFSGREKNHSFKFNEELVPYVTENIMSSDDIIHCRKNYKIRKLKPKKTQKKIIQVDQNKTHHCDFCNRNFCSDLALKGHMWSHGNRNLTCQICNSFVDASSSVCLNAMCELSGNTCQICGRTFKTNTRLRDHYSEHSTIKMFSCKTCGKQFKKERQLKFHTNGHSGARPYKCPALPGRLARPVQLPHAPHALAPGTCAVSLKEVRLIHL